MTTQTPPSDHRRPDRWNQTPVPARVAERAFLRRKVDANGCWISTYSVASHGYAQVGWWADGKGHMVLAHRASWTHVHGQVPTGMTIDHLCKTRTCVNPSHLRLLSNHENARRNNGEDWAIGTCRNGHPDAMLRKVKRRAKSGREYLGMQCLECRREYNRRWRTRNPERYREMNARNNAKRRAA